MNELEHRLSRVLIASGIVVGLLFVILWCITNPAKFYAFWPVGDQAWAIGGFVVAGIVMFISGLIGFSEVVGYVKTDNCNVAGAFAGIFIFLLVASLMGIYGEHLYYQMEVYSTNPDLKIFTGWKCDDVNKLAGQFPDVPLLHSTDYGSEYYSDVSIDYSGTDLGNCGNSHQFTNQAVWNGTHWIESIKHTEKAKWNGTSWLEPPTSFSMWNSTTNTWTLTNTTYTFTANKSNSIIYCTNATCPPSKTYTDYGNANLTQGTNASPDIQPNPSQLEHCNGIDQYGNHFDYYAEKCERAP